MQVAQKESCLAVEQSEEREENSASMLEEETNSKGLPSFMGPPLCEPVSTPAPPPQTFHR